MRNLIVVRKELAEKGIELTPSELVNLVKDLKKVQRRLMKNADLKDMTLWEKQDFCQKAANQGTEISPDELEDIIEVSTKIRAIEF